jgi:hypothetical protein
MKPDDDLRESPSTGHDGDEDPLVMEKQKRRRVQDVLC